MAKTNKVFPAYAGVILLAYQLKFHLVSFPRIRGGDPSSYSIEKFATLFSPHTRG